MTIPKSVSWPNSLLCQPSGCYITGTDTGVGKTLVTGALAVCLARRGVDVGIMKPIETGVSSELSSPSDGTLLNTLNHQAENLERVSPYRFLFPLAPLDASRKEHLPIQFSRIRSIYFDFAKRYDFLLVEGVGGVMVPLTEHLSVRDLIQQLGIPCIVVSRALLGTVNHTLLTLHALQGLNIPVLAVILNTATKGPLTKEQECQNDSTIGLIQEFSSLPVFGPLPHTPQLEKNWKTGIKQMAEEKAINELGDLLLTKHR